MSRKLIIDGNAVYELDEKCMLKKKLENVQVEKIRWKSEREVKRILMNTRECSGCGKDSCNI